jgi:type I site-specific restriction-modification system R (restriction) subunit
MSLHNEINFETEICEHLAANGWLYSPNDDGYDRARALFPDDVLAWVQATQPKAWDAIVKNHGANAADTLLTRLRDSLDQRGTLDVLRHGIEMLGLRGKLLLAQFKPALAMNPDILARYAANRLRVVRQLHYSQHNENSLDLGLFLNGLPMATAELKTDFTQSIGDAMDQYRFDRHPKPKGQAAEPLLSFPSGALVHFAVSNREVYMTTRLNGTDTVFLPFNQGDHGAAGNPLNPGGGHRTAYLWEQVWDRHSWLEILGRYLVAQKDDKKQIKSIIFPRFHQLDATRKLQAAVLTEGPGGKYLIQHSAGSGKTNSIAWSAHFLADLHDALHNKLFDTVLVVSDRNVIDSQLQEAIFDFERTTGVVATIKGESSSKSSELAAALSGDKKIVVCTIQTFPFALKAVRELAATQGKRFAVIADEAHSSQTGEAAAKLKAVLSAEELRELGDGGEVSTEDILAAQMATRADDAGVTYVAFTATPKTKTLELFGTRPDPSRPASKDNLPAPFHVYSMQQAIEEKFILDVLQNYTTYKLAFKLAQTIERNGASHRSPDGTSPAASALPLTENIERNGASHRSPDASSPAASALPLTENIERNGASHRSPDAASPAASALPLTENIERNGASHRSPDGTSPAASALPLTENIERNGASHRSPDASSPAASALPLTEREVERGAAMKGIMGWVRLHPYNISQKVEIVVEHFRQHVAPLLTGTAKAMVVVGSRLEAVRWKLAIDNYIKNRGYTIRTLVAFSGEVTDKESGPDPFSENSKELNPNLRGRDIREAFKGDEYQILLVANKFQTGFDQPLLCGMYVDKRLAGIQAVQTLSRLNRAYPGKETYVLDFVNNAEEVLAAFKTYHATAELTDVTDPNLVYNLRAKLDAAGHYDDFEVDRVVAVELKPNAKQSELAAAVEPVVDRLHKKYKAAQTALKLANEKKDKPAAETAQNQLNALLLFQRDMGAFQRLYTYLSQIFDYGNTAIEKRSIFYKQVLRLLEFGREREGIDLSKVVLTHHTLKDQGKRAMPLGEGEYPKLEPITEVGGGSVYEKQTAYLTEIIKKSQRTV